VNINTHQRVVFQLGCIYSYGHPCSFSFYKNPHKHKVSIKGLSLFPNSMCLKGFTLSKVVSFMICFVSYLNLKCLILHFTLIVQRLEVAEFSGLKSTSCITYASNARESSFSDVVAAQLTTKVIF